MSISRIARLLLHAPGLTPTAVLEKLAEIKMIDVWPPTFRLGSMKSSIVVKFSLA